MADVQTDDTTSPDGQPALRRVMGPWPVSYTHLTLPTIYSV